MVGVGRHPNPKDLQSWIFKSQAGNLRVLEKMFADRKLCVISEAHAPEGKIFYTSLGRPVRHGFIIKDEKTGEKFFVGFKTLRALHDVFHAVPLPGKFFKKSYDTTN